MTFSSGREVRLGDDGTNEEAVGCNVGLNVSNVESSGERIRKIDGRGSLRRSNSVSSPQSISTEET